MSYRVTLTANGYQIETDSVEEVRALLLSGNKMPAPAIPRVEDNGGETRHAALAAGKLPRTTHVATTPEERQDIALARIIKALRYLRDHGPLVGGNVLAKYIGYTNSHGLSRLGFAVKIRARSHGLQTTDIMEVIHSEGGSFWRLGKQGETFLRIMESRG